MTPTVAAFEIFTAGLPKLGWLNTFVAVNSRRARACSPSRKCFASPASKTTLPGPTITPFAAVPKLPGCGGPKAVGSNHRLTVRRADGSVGSRSVSVLSVTFAGVRLDVNAVPVGSGPLHCGVRNCPEYELKIQLDSQPPTIAFRPLPAFAKNLLFSPNGSSKTVLAVTRW